MLLMDSEQLSGYYFFFVDNILQVLEEIYSFPVCKWYTFITVS